MHTSYIQNGGGDGLLMKMIPFINNFLISQPILIKFAQKLFVCKCLPLILLFGVHYPF